MHDCLLGPSAQGLSFPLCMRTCRLYFPIPDVGAYAIMPSIFSLPAKPGEGKPFHAGIWNAPPRCEEGTGTSFFRLSLGHSVWFCVQDTLNRGRGKQNRESALDSLERLAGGCCPLQGKSGRGEPSASVTTSLPSCWHHTPRLLPRSQGL